MVPLSRSSDVSDIVNVVAAPAIVMGRAEIEQMTWKKGQKHHTVI